MQRGKMEVGKRTEGGVLGYKESVYIRTSISNTRPGQGNASGSRCVRLCNGGSTISKMQR